MTQLQKTTEGLPNTCTNCGREPGQEWYAENKDAARSGAGYCHSCAIEIDPSTAVTEPAEEAAEPAAEVEIKATRGRK